MNKSLFIWLLVLISGLLLIIQSALLSVHTTSVSKTAIELEQNINVIVHRIDSLENEINHYLLNKKDTIIINNYPQTIKIYQNNE